ncbi:MAG: hypothetical protein GX451_11570, partial [Acholeplasmataceae bacterium]|nr:hypothetical protein [Acholeplasmataceae bacterium]
MILSYKCLLIEKINQHVSCEAGRAYTNKTREQETVVDDELADVCGTGTVKADA